MIRRANTKDIPAIMEIVKASIEVMKDEGNDQWVENYPLEHHYEKDIKAGNLYVWEENNQVLGVACISPEGHHEYDEINWLYAGAYFCMKRLAVHPVARGKGIALQFYQFAEKLALDEGIHIIRTDTYSKNKGAIHLFKKANYHFVQERINDGRSAPFYYFEKKF